MDVAELKTEIYDLKDRRKEVALNADPVSPHELQPLSDADSWALFSNKILALSYSDLPFYLKPCFLYLGLFPEDSSISARKLSKIWVAEGFVIQHGDELAEDIADEYLEELADRCMVRVSKRKPTGIQRCRIHNLLRDLSISKAKEVKFLHIRTGINSTSAALPLTSARRLAFHPIADHIIPGPPYQHVHSAFYFCPLKRHDLDRIFQYTIVYGMFGVLDLRYLGDLDVESYPILPDAVGKLIHLRYLYSSEEIHVIHR
ncbi:hypothetical protein GIB67_000190 [Kingdonia uniflora]|uniref:Disease resistance protein winged helix domain-containing protein n=1 Tax=Kingdonia uniflora TaxID=39325 RepID=A0A7J7P9K9_9MAGN|nr:hypothetical protein GIB67_000190 [Kingdonia uniflora]